MPRKSFDKKGLLNTAAGFLFLVALLYVKMGPSLSFTTGSSSDEALDGSGFALAAGVALLSLELPVRGRENWKYISCYLKALCHLLPHLPGTGGCLR